MALIHCPDCQKQVSDKAKVCPSCNRPINAKSFALGAFFYLGLIVIGIILFLAKVLPDFANFTIIGLGLIGFAVIVIRKFLS